MLGSGVTVVMLVVECLAVGLSTVSKVAMSRGMSNFVFVVYSNILAIFVLLHSSLLFYRKRRPPSPPFSIVCKIFLLGLIACSTQIMIYEGLGYSSPTLSSAMTNLTPAFTFLLAITTRMEKLDLRIRSGQAKSTGTALLITGAFIITLYKGPSIIFTSLPKNAHNELHLSSQTNWVLGGMLLAVGALSLALLFIVQTWIIRAYPEELIVTGICSLFVIIQSAIIAIIAEKNPDAWGLKPDMGLIAIVYYAVFGVSIRNVVHTWACRKKGPLYVSMFKPLEIVIAMVMAVGFLGDVLYLGSVIGGVIIASGFYAVIWGKTEEEKVTVERGRCNLGSSCNTPLLKNKSMEV